VRYKYIAYKYTRQVIPDTSFQSSWESFCSWPTCSTIAWRPPTDIYETRNEIIVVLELAGVDEKAMTVTLFSDLLVVEGRREQPVTEMSACHQLGIKYGDFRSEVAIHVPIEHDGVVADYKNGLLKIIFQKRD
jgi:HSP20 family protein